MTAAETEALAKISFIAYGAFTLPFEDLPSAEQERWRAVARAMHRALVVDRDMADRP